MALIIDARTGTILESGDCYIVDTDDLTESQEWYLENGGDTDIADVARSAGVPLSDEALEWVRYGRTTSVSYGPSALRDEAQVLLEILDPDDVEDIATRGYLERLLEAGDAEVAMLGQHILNDDAVWNGYKQNLIDGLHSFYGRDPF